MGHFLGSDIGSGHFVAFLVALLTVVLWLWKQRASSRTDVATSLPQRKQLQRYSTAQVAEHCSQKDCWIVVMGKVYDVSSYVEEHPGGLAILKNAGGDATEGFHGPQHPPRVFDMIDDFLIGHLVD